MKLLITCLWLIAPLLSFAQTPCENGSANGFPCNQVSFYSRLEPEALMAVEYRGYSLNDIWGWTDPENGKEYAIVGISDGVTFVDISDPSDPKVIGKLLEPSTAAVDRRVTEIQHGKSSWRDMKTFKNHVFVISDNNAEHGMQVFDLTRLRGFDGSEVQEFTEDTRYDGVNSAHNIVINESTGYAYIVGATTGSYCNQGGLHILDINDPKNPEYLACFDEDGYTHDAQCVIYQGPDNDYTGQEVCFNSNEDTFTIVNVDDKENMSMISRTGYEDAAYTHQGWLSEDHRFFLQNDESDEVDFRYNARTIIWNIEDLDNPVYLGSYYNNAEAIDHNLYIHQNLVYEANYLSGLRILCTDRLADGQMREVAFFDTFPEADIIAYGGAWSSYPFFESGVIAVSDMTQGLFLLKIDTVPSPITHHPMDETLCEGTPLSISVETTSETLDYQWDYFDGEEYVSIDGAESSSLAMIASEEFANQMIRCTVTDADSRIFYSYPASYTLSGTLPEANFSFSIADLTVTFVNESVNADTYLWDFGDGNTSSEANPTHEYEESNGYEVKLIAYNDCGADSLTQAPAIITGLYPRDQLSIYPNPTQGVFTVKNPTPYSMHLYHAVTGQLVMSQQYLRGEQAIDGSMLAPGLYLLEIRSTEQTLFERLLIR